LIDYQHQKKYFYFLAKIIVKIFARMVERGEAPSVPGLIYKVERQELDVKI